MIHFEVSLTAMKVVIATSVVCIKIVMIMNEKDESAEVLIQNSKFSLFSLNQFFHIFSYSLT